jgi:hypothetical protein
MIVITRLIIITALYRYYLFIVTKIWEYESINMTYKYGTTRFYIYRLWMQEKPPGKNSIIYTYVDIPHTHAITKRVSCCGLIICNLTVANEDKLQVTYAANNFRKSIILCGVKPWSLVISCSRPSCNANVYPTSAYFGNICFIHCIKEYTGSPLCYKPDGRGLDFRWRHWIFQLA